MRRTKVGGVGTGGVVGVGLAGMLLSGCGSADWLGGLFDAGTGSSTSDSGLTASNASTLKQKWRLQGPGCQGVGTGGGWLATPVTFKGVIYEGSNFGCL